MSGFFGLLIQRARAAPAQAFVLRSRAASLENVGSSAGQHGQLPVERRRPGGRLMSPRRSMCTGRHVPFDAMVEPSPTNSRCGGVHQLQRREGSEASSVVQLGFENVHRPARSCSAWVAFGLLLGQDFGDARRHRGLGWTASRGTVSLVRGQTEGFGRSGGRRRAVVPA